MNAAVVYVLHGGRVAMTVLGVKAVKQIRRVLAAGTDISKWRTILSAMGVSFVGQLLHLLDRFKGVGLQWI